MTGRGQEPPARWFSIAHIALIVPWIALVIDAWGPIGDNSFLWHIRAGELQLAQGSVLTTDPFSFTMGGHPWMTQSWLVEILYAWAEDVSGLGFVPWMILIVSTLTFFAIGLVAYRQSHSVPATVFVLVLSTLALISFLVPRPVLFSFLLMTLVILAWERPATRWVIPFLFWIWAAVHASFLIGGAYMGLRIIMRREWKALRIAVPAGVATLLTAHGVGVIGFLANFAENRVALRYLTEWRRPELLSTVFLPFLGGVVFVVIGAFRRRIYPRHLWLLVPFVALAMTSVRAIPPAWLAVVPMVALSLSGLEIGTRRGLRLRLAAVFAIVVLVLPFAMIDDARLAEEKFPLVARAELEDVPTFHDDRTGGYLIWAEGPERKVYLDDRAELYGERIEEFVQVRNGVKDWKPVFERDGVRQALLVNAEPLIDSLHEGGWGTVYQDDYFTILRP